MIKGKISSPWSVPYQARLTHKSYHLCAMKNLHSSTHLVSPAPNGAPDVLPHCGPVPLTSFPPSPSDPETKALIPALCSLSWQKGLKEENGCSKDWVNLSGRMWVAQSYQMLMWDLHVAGGSTSSLPMLCCLLSCSHSAACHWRTGSQNKKRSEAFLVCYAV